MKNNCVFCAIAEGEIPSFKAGRPASAGAGRFRRPAGRFRRRHDARRSGRPAGRPASPGAGRTRRSEASSSGAGRPGRNARRFRRRHDARRSRRPAGRRSRGYGQYGQPDPGKVPGRIQGGLGSSTERSRRLPCENARTAAEALRDQVTRIEFPEHNQRSIGRLPPPVGLFFRLGLSLLAKLIPDGGREVMVSSCPALPS